MTALEEDTESQPGPMSWKQKIEPVAILLSILLIVVLVVDFAKHAERFNPFLDKPTKCSVELVAARGIGSALGPGAESSSSPAFDLLVHVDNGHVFAIRDGGSDVVVSYAGVPLARGRAPAFDVEAKEAVKVAVGAASHGVGIPDELFLLMVQERRSGATPQLQIDLWLDFGLFRCSVELHGEQRASQCDKLNFIYTS
ncbi:hypothetical protein HU200_043027 [Digitaria exilis]|uniref:Late embryogenesis abundant protein LEA-2 subgroup domain-containing protein n=1 Tax=Digitaria exilis TaxID=1010633 RepID=A0A835BA26_9POAL|nr:hypothetical protein HU200_043027 [Digitaria exilis]